jgi:hypothetical protein
VAATDAQLAESYELARRNHALLTRVHDAVLRLRDVRGQAEAWGKRSESPAIRDAAAALAKALTAVEEELIQVRSEDPRMFPAKLNTKIATMVGLIEYADAAPTQALRELTETLARAAEAELARLERVLADDVAAFNARGKSEGLAAIVPPPTR